MPGPWLVGLLSVCVTALLMATTTTEAHLRPALHAGNHNTKEQPEVTSAQQEPASRTKRSTWKTGRGGSSFFIPVYRKSGSAGVWPGIGGGFPGGNTWPGIGGGFPGGNTWPGIFGSFPSGGGTWPGVMGGSSGIGWPGGQGINPQSYIKQVSYVPIGGAGGRGGGFIHGGGGGMIRGGGMMID